MPIRRGDARPGSETPPPVDPEDPGSVYARLRWLKENDWYSDDPLAGPAPHPQPCPEVLPFGEARNSTEMLGCHPCQEWTTAVQRGWTLAELAADEERMDRELTESILQQDRAEGTNLSGLNPGAE